MQGQRLFSCVLMGMLLFSNIPSVDGASFFKWPCLRRTKNIKKAFLSRTHKKMLLGSCALVATCIALYTCRSFFGLKKTGLKNDYSGFNGVPLPIVGSADPELQSGLVGGDSSKNLPPSFVRQASVFNIPSTRNKYNGDRAAAGTSRKIFSESLSQKPNHLPKPTCSLLERPLKRTRKKRAGKRILIGQNQNKQNQESLVIPGVEFAGFHIMDPEACLHLGASFCPPPTPKKNPPYQKIKAHYGRLFHLVEGPVSKALQGMFNLGDEKVKVPIPSDPYAMSHGDFARLRMFFETDQEYRNFLRDTLNIPDNLILNKGGDLCDGAVYVTLRSHGVTYDQIMLSDLNFGKNLEGYKNAFDKNQLFEERFVPEGKIISIKDEAKKYKIAMKFQQDNQSSFDGDLHLIKGERAEQNDYNRLRSCVSMPKMAKVLMLQTVSSDQKLAYNAQISRWENEYQDNYLKKHTCSTQKT